MAKKKTDGKKPSNQKSKMGEFVKQYGTIIRIVSVAILVLALVILLSRNADTGNNTEQTTLGVDDLEKSKPVATIEMENGSLIKIELDPVNAPNTVKNFIALAEDGFYDGLIFHRVVPGFVIQGGCPEGTGRGGPGYAIKGEFAANGHTNELTHERGVISMARSNLPDSAGSQFFITVAETPQLDGQYAAFGTVIEGMDEADRIVAVPRDQADKPLEEERIKQIQVETYGVQYDPPEKI